MDGELDAGTSALIGRIYQSVHDTRAFDAALAAAMPAAGATVAVVIGAEPEGVSLTLHGAHNPDYGDFIEEYQAELWAIDPTFVHFTRTHPGARFFDTALHRDPAAHVEDAYLPWHKHIIGSTNWMACHAPRAEPGGGTRAFGIAFHPGRGQVDPFTDRQRATFRMLFEHLERARTLALRPPAIDTAAEPLLLVDPRGRVTAASAAAEALLAAGDGLVQRDGRLSTADPREARRFRALIESALNAVARGGAGGEMLVERPGGRRPLAVTVDPLPAQAELASLARGAIVRVIDPEAGPPPAAVARWRSLWSLTPAETRAAAALVDRQFDLRAAAEACGVTYATMRTQLAALFAKTGTGGQPELMRLLTRVGG